MKIVITILIVVISSSLFAQGPNTNITSLAQSQTDTGNQQTNPTALAQQSSQNSFDLNNKENPCTDCDEVKQAIKTSHASSGRSHQKKSFSMRRWSKTVEGKMNMKMKKVFAHRKKVKTNFDLCFNWQ